ncbi:MAG TPA: hypothetical protein VMF89_25525 [Polyangiales bacterium]|nr:hypothetical protein [Polyangiales bacterium]
MLFALISAALSAIPGTVHVLQLPDVAIRFQASGATTCTDGERLSSTLVQITWSLLGCSAFVALWTIGMKMATHVRDASEALRLACYCTAPFPLLILLQVIGIPSAWIGLPLLATYGYFSARRFQSTGAHGIAVVMAALVLGVVCALCAGWLVSYVVRHAATSVISC